VEGDVSLRNMFAADAPDQFDAGLPPMELLAQKKVRFFVCSSVEDEEAHLLLHDFVYPRLESDANRRGVSLAFIDFRPDLATWSDEELGNETMISTIADLMLREVERCAPFFLGLFSDEYGQSMGDSLVSELARRGHPWVQGEGLEDHSLADMLLRAFFRTELSTACFSFFLLQHTDAHVDPSLSPPGLEGARTPTTMQRDLWRDQVSATWNDGEKDPKQQQLEDAISRFKFTICPNYVK
jgi:hypothetical protein